MDWSVLFSVMQPELILTGIILLILLAEISLNKKDIIVDISIILFLILTIAGFVNNPDGKLFGGMFRTDQTINMLKNILNVGVLIILFQSASWVKNKMKASARLSEFYILMFSSLLGMYFMISSGDFLMFYIGIELASLPVAGLAAFDTFKVRSNEAGLKYIFLAAITSGVSLFGMSLLYAASGTIYFEQLTTFLTFDPLVILGFLFFITGLLFKISIVPFHLWTADVYEGAPINVTSYLSVISKGSSAFILLIFLFTFARPLMDLWRELIFLLSIVTMFFGNFFALRQKNMKRFLAFSSIAQAGFLILGMISGSQLGMTSVVFFVATYIFSNLGAFGVVYAIANNTGKEEMDDYNGFYRTNPLLSVLMMLSLFSLAGIPPVAGFFGKFFLFMSAASAGYYWLIFIAVINVTISLYYYLLVVRAMFVRRSENPIPYFKSDNYLRVGLVLASVGILSIGFYSPIYEHINELVAHFLNH
jgi:NADH-quinone oxidoreductase subunit N